MVNPRARRRCPFLLGREYGMRGRHVFGLELLALDVLLLPLLCLLHRL